MKPFGWNWYGDYANIVTLIQWMCENGYNVSEVSRAVEKPWNYEAEYLAAALDMDGPDFDLLNLELQDDVDVLEELRSRKRSQELDEAKF